MTTRRTHSRIPARQLTDPFIFLFSLTLFLSAALTFTIQPMIGKMLLPLVGGTPSGWLVTMVYFQMTLLAGYAIAHALSHVTVLKHMMIVGLLLLSGLLLFPLRLEAGFIQSYGLPDALGVLLALGAALTLPCVALFTLSPSLQRLFEAGSSRTGRDPYFLFAASNCGSLGGLLAYPLVMERISGLSLQGFLWEISYFALIVLCALCLFIAYVQMEKTRKAKPKTANSIGWSVRGKWVLLAFIPSSLMLGITAHITTDTGSVPLFWVLPLALYLLTFVLAFARRQVFTLSNIDFLQTASIAVLIAFFIKTPAIVSAPEDMLFPLTGFFMTALFCHFTLAAERPAPEKLTEFYLWIAIGGALGGLFNTLVAPFVFVLPVEFIVVALLSCLIHPERKGLQHPHIKRLLLIAGITAAIASIICGVGFFHDGKHLVLDILATALLVGSLIVTSLSPRLLVGISLVFSLFAVSVHNAHLLDMHRDFYGVLRVFDNQNHDANMTVRALYHGSTMHGQEEVRPEIDTTPNGYYDTEGPLGDLIKFHPSSDIGIVGIGTGTSLCYQAPGRHYTVYELDPAVPVMAEKWFDYMRVCGTPKIVIGDGRRSLAAATNTRHGLVIVDAFTSDAIPVHLLTREAFRIYFSRLKPDGILAIHVSNRFYDLRYPISDVISDLGLHALCKLSIPPKPLPPLAMANRWIVVAHSEAELKPLIKKGWAALPPSGARVWTDDFSDTLSALTIMHSGAGQ